MDQLRSFSSGIFFRSDTRDPDQIFRDGFARDGDPQAPMQLRNRNPMYGDIDMEPRTAISVTRDFNAAAIFPVDTPNARSWVYVFQAPHQSPGAQNCVANR
jgi:hypothetical protein